MFLEKINNIANVVFSDAAHRINQGVLYFQTVIRIHGKGKGKGKFHPRTGHKGPEGE